MLRLSLVRHAKSSWKNDLISDHERPLKTRGINDSKMMAKVLLDRGFVPSFIYCSTALRSQLTVQLMNEVFGLQGEHIRYDSMLYRAWADNLLAYAKNESKNEHTMIVAHNPGIHELIEKLTDTHLEKFQTGAVASIVFDCQHWSDIDYGTGKLDEYLYPRMFY
ncbi:MAG: histidine phosphatase family protein [Spirochaetes bacterium]|jgi:phosphohistidine phosphatase|nr:histidine phosphatase family protein [Spirochaetota bacterium]